MLGVKPLAAVLADQLAHGGGHRPIRSQSATSPVVGSRCSGDRLRRFA
jgi:hypothetical protein